MEENWLSWHLWRTQDTAVNAPIWVIHVNVLHCSLSFIMAFATACSIIQLRVITERIKSTTAWGGHLLLYQTFLNCYFIQRKFILGKDWFNHEVADNGAITFLAVTRNTITCFFGNLMSFCVPLRLNIEQCKVCEKVSISTTNSLMKRNQIIHS